MPVCDDVGGLSFEAETYTVRRSYLREAFGVSDADGNRFLDAERNAVNGTVTFPFRDAYDEEAFRVSSKQVFDVAGDYVLVEDGADETALVLSKKLSFRHHRWTIDRPDGRELAAVTAQRGLDSAVNTVTAMHSPFPQTFAVTAPNGEHVGTIAGRLHPRTVYDLRIERPGATSRAALVGGAVAVAVLESV